MKKTKQLFAIFTALVMICIGSITASALSYDDLSEGTYQIHAELSCYIHYQLELLHLIKELNRKKSMTIIMVLHDINLALAFCDEVIIMKDGCITAQGEIDTAVTESVLSKAFEVSCKIVLIDGKKHCIFSRKGGTYGKTD